MAALSVLCSCCGRKIYAGEYVVLVRSGLLSFTAHPHARVGGSDVDYFCGKCASQGNVAVRPVPLPEGATFACTDFCLRGA